MPAITIRPKLEGARFNVGSQVINEFPRLLAAGVSIPSGFGVVIDGIFYTVNCFVARDILALIVSAPFTGPVAYFLGILP